MKKLQGVKATEWGRQVVVQNPKYESVLARLSGEELSREERVQLIHDVEALHSFDCMINRTRRRDIQDFCVRRSHTISVPMSMAQAELHRNLLEFEDEALRIMHGDRGILFMTSTIRRQAASCIFGLAPCISAMIDFRFNQLEGDDLEGILRKTLTKLPQALIEKAKELMLKTDMRMNEIAMKVGINNPNYFSILFKKYQVFY